MKKFKYNMENILQIKLKLEDQAKIAYGNARLRLTREEEKLSQMEKKKASFEDELRLLRSDRLDLIKIKHCEEAVAIMKNNIKQQAVAVRNAQQRLEVARIRLNNAMIERKMQEKLKEKAWDNYLLEFEAEERKEVDQLNSFHYSNPALGEEDR
jgi:flagellar FliJ protein